MEFDSSERVCIDTSDVCTEVPVELEDSIVCAIYENPRNILSDVLQCINLNKEEEIDLSTNEISLEGSNINRLSELSLEDVARGFRNSSHEWERIAIPKFGYIHTKGKEISYDRKWQSRKTLKIKFLGSVSDNIKTRIIYEASEWIKYAKLKFEIINDNSMSDIRIILDQKVKGGAGSWSTIGTDAIRVPKNEPTMCLAILSGNSLVNNFSITVKHEFGHALGAIHEHQRSDASFKWDEEKVIQYYEDNFNWPRQKTIDNILYRYMRETLNASKYDPLSIMCYVIPPDFINSGEPPKRNEVLSDQDKKFIAKIYM